MERLNHTSIATICNQISSGEISLLKNYWSREQQDRGWHAGAVAYVFIQRNNQDVGTVYVK